MRKGPGKTARAVLNYIISYLEEYAYPPSVREIGTALGLKSTATVHLHLKTLESYGYIRMDPNKQRSISLLKKDIEEAHLALERGSSIMAVPLVGSVAAGTPILALENVQDYISLPRSFLHGGSEGEVFLLQVEGTSMIEAGINSGDLLLVHQGMAVENGEIAVACVPSFDADGATVKRVYYEGDTVRLQPENSAMEPIILSRDAVRIVGRVIGLIRRY